MNEKAEQQRTKALTLLTQIRAHYQSFADAIAPDQLHVQGQFVPYSAWSAKDVLGHVDFWNDLRANRMEAMLRGETPPTYDDFDALNELEYHARHAWTWEQHWNRAMQTLERFAALVKSTPDSFLETATDAQLPAWLIRGNALEHASLHFADYYAAQNDPTRAETIFHAYIAMFDVATEEAERAAGVYNLACYHAKWGEAEKALGLLSEAFKVRPDLKEWAQHDPDLESLQTLPQFAGLVR